MLQYTAHFTKNTEATKMASVRFAALFFRSGSVFLEGTQSAVALCRGETGRRASRGGQWRLLPKGGLVLLNCLCTFYMASYLKSHLTVREKRMVLAF